MKRNKSLTLFTAFLALAFGTACLTLFPTDERIQPERGSLKFDPETLPNAQVGVPYEVEIKVTQNVTPVGDFSVAPERLPPGLELVMAEDVGDTARITGTPEELGTFTFVVSVWCYGTNVSGQVGDMEYTIVVE